VEAGFPPSVLNVITGSTETGKLVVRDAADHVAKVSLELGG
jgi:acyl-CoA reductase-like NAD-dependent aldehyde dehydrogenase